MRITLNELKKIIRNEVKREKRRLNENKEDQQEQLKQIIRNEVKREKRWLNENKEDQQEQLKQIWEEDFGGEISDSDHEELERFLEMVRNLNLSYSYTSSDKGYGDHGGTKKVYTIRNDKHQLLADLFYLANDISDDVGWKLDTDF